MIIGFSVAVAICALVLAVWCAVLAARNREPGTLVLVALAVLESLLLVQVIISVALMIGGDSPASLATFLAYLIGSLFVLPIGTVWALAERSRASTMVLVIACVAIPVLVLRMQEVWGGARA